MINTEAYNIVAGNLWIISNHPTKVSQGLEGHEITLESILECYNFEPKEWFYKTGVSFLDILPVDQRLIQKSLKSVMSCSYSKELLGFCFCCRQLALFFDQKILEAQLPSPRDSRTKKATD